MNYKCLILLLFFTALSEVKGQDKGITVKVIYAEPNFENVIESGFYILPGAQIFLPYLTKIGITNEQGIFQLYKNILVDSITISSVGYNTEKIKVSKQCDLLEIILMPHVTYDFVSAKKLAQLTKKERRILPDLYALAIKKGLFKQDKPCR